MALVMRNKKSRKKVYKSLEWLNEVLKNGLNENEND